jgi:hypothetical protein
MPKSEFPIVNWATIVREILCDGTSEQRVRALELALAEAKKELEEDRKSGGLRVIKPGDPQVLAHACMAMGPTTMELRSRTIYRLTRKITNNTAPKIASELLFQLHRHVAGSGYLDEYLERPLDIYKNKGRAA